MGRTNTKNAHARTSITYLKGVDMSKLLDEIVSEFKASRPPKDAITIKMFLDKLKSDGIVEDDHFARDWLKEKVKHDGWKELSWKGKLWFWKP